MANVFITGGTGLLGFQMVTSLLEEGHHVSFTSRDKQKALKMVIEHDISEKQVSVLEVDFSNENYIERLKSQIVKPIDILIFNARDLSNLKMNRSGEVSYEDFQNEFAMAVTIPYQLTNLFSKNRKTIKDIIFIGSMYGSVAPSPSLYEDFESQSLINYGVSKAAQLHLCRELSVRLADKNIRCNSISYGGIEGRVDSDFKARYAKLNPMGKMLTLDDIYPPIKFIIDNPTLKMTGENIKIDGGWTIW